MKKTTCTDCGNEVFYKTNKPKRCATCREKREMRFKHRKKKLIRSKKEGEMQRVLNQLFPHEDYIDNGYYSWLMSPKGAPLQLDRYYPRLKLAFEFNGQQHYKYNPYMHQSIEAFQYLQKCDAKKKKDCKRKGVHLITIKYTKKITKEYIIKRLDQAGILDEIEGKTFINY